MRIVFTLFVALFLAFIVSDSSAAKNSGLDVTSRITGNLEKFETILNEKGEPEILLNFLHETISNSAEFHVRIQSDAAPDAGQNEVTLNKADYINSYLYGPRQVLDYSADIQVLDVTLNDDAQGASSKEILTERGYIKDPAKPNDYPKGFVSRTACQSDYVLDDAQNPVLSNSVCKTDIMFEQGV